ncbi:30S ribosomal protein S8 [Tessaracoccus defluvii]|uniref:Small ribosomal subunit protein uS8 n=1 Tax=Tessaracoccus defluvii TaxID=1285901 RepID=A0A7H0H6U7_9ACTN|nr:30S ribosomal protein S8 [Tessaracoccus defluvii]QNP56263.1 30S ribosomal protein S8 [Tessaracoccus defluvii]
MTMTDPIADMLTRLRNANQAYQDSTSMPSSKIKVNIAEILKKNGYIAAYELTEVEGQVGKVLKVTLKYGDSRERALAGLKRVSKPGLRVYRKADELPKVLGGLGIAIISTSQGLLTDRDAKAKSVGGEVLAYIW